MKRPLISRRTILKAGGVAIALPFLEAMRPRRAHGDGTTPRRFIVVVGGHSLGPDFKGAQLGDPAAMPSMVGETVPAAAGRDYVMPFGWQPLERVRDHLCAVTNLRIPVPERINVFHRYGSLFQLSGTWGNNEFVPAPTADQLVAPALSSPGLAFPSLAVSSDFPVLPLSHGASGGGAVAPRTPIVNPHQLFQSLFGGFTAGATPAEKAQRALLQKKNASILDLVLRQSAALKGQLGRADQQRLEGHLDAVRSLEQRVQMTPPPESSVCKAPGDPGPDPASADGVDWDARARVVADLIHQAVACDLTRVVLWQQSETTGTALTIPLSSGERLNIHDAAHGQQKKRPGVSYMRDVALLQRWHTDKLAHLVERFRDTPEGAGSLLDNTVIVYLCDLGFGLEYQGNPPAWSSHGNQFRQVLYATGVPGLRVGTHVVTQQADPSAVLLTLMRAVGYAGDLGGARAVLPELLGA